MYAPQHLRAPPIYSSTKNNSIADMEEYFKHKSQTQATTDSAPKK